MGMVEVAWATLGVLTASTFGMFGMFFYLSSRIDRMAAGLKEMRVQMASFSTRLEAHIEHHAG